MKDKKVLNLILLIFCIISTAFLPITIILNELNFSDKESEFRLLKVQSSTCNSIPICTLNNKQHHAEICSDGEGGAIITWMDQRSGSSASDYDIYAQKLDSNGNKLWTLDGKEICLASEIQTIPQLCPDGEGGAIITWMDRRDSGNRMDIYAQRINSSGEIEWTNNGEAICTAAEDQMYPRICSDGLAGAIITWYDYRNVTHSDIYVQRIDCNGTVRWFEQGVQITRDNAYQMHPHICSDGAGGAIIVWKDERNSINDDIYAQRVDSDGNVLWTDEGEIICIENDYQGWLAAGGSQICSDGAGGAIITWHDKRSGYLDVYTQRIDSNGQVKWTIDGNPITLSNNEERDPKLCSIGSGGVIITWQNSSDIYAQKLDIDGNIQWLPNNKKVCIAPEYQSFPEICSDGAGGAIITWEDHRYDYDIYAQKIDSNGQVQGSIEGAIICVNDYDAVFPRICSDGAGEAFIVWDELRNDPYINDVFAYHTGGSSDNGDSLLILILIILGIIVVIIIVIVIIIKLS